MKTTTSHGQKQVLPAPRPQLAVRSDVRAGLSGSCELGVGYWRKELNDLRKLANALNCA